MCHQPVSITMSACGSSSNNQAEVDRAIRTLMEKINAMDENAMPPPPPPPPPTPAAKPANRKRRKREIPVGWTVKNEPPFDSPSCNWSDGSCQYTVKNPTNYGNVLLKMSVFHSGRPTFNCGVYLDERQDDETFIYLTDLMSRLENMWINSDTGVPKTDGIVRTVTPLPTWRRTPNYTTPVEVQRKKVVGDCTTRKKRSKV